ncbi:MAG: hypothetical protein JZD41_07685 [Thermoproteus sp.]|nr:hypothetical protein [Thermoproteus sp.]
MTYYLYDCDYYYIIADDEYCAPSWFRRHTLLCRSGVMYPGCNLVGKLDGVEVEGHSPLFVSVADMRPYYYVGVAAVLRSLDVMKKAYPYDVIGTMIRVPFAVKCRIGNMWIRCMLNEDFLYITRKAQL